MLELKTQNNIRLEVILGKAEVDSSILSGGTIFPLFIKG